LNYPSRWVAIKLLENDPEIKKLVASSESINQAAEALAAEISAIHHEPSFAVIASERYGLASKIASEAQRQAEVRTTFSDRV
jgi:ferrous iron transport protein B